MTIQMYGDLLISYQSIMAKNLINKDFAKDCIPNCIRYFVLDNLTMLGYN